jgi:hypothetical protein
MHDDIINTNNQARAPQVLALPPTQITPAICCFSVHAPQPMLARTICAGAIRACCPQEHHPMCHKHVASCYTPVKAYALMTAQYCTPLHEPCCTKRSRFAHGYCLCEAQMSQRKPKATPNNLATTHTDFHAYQTTKKLQAPLASNRRMSQQLRHPAAVNQNKHTLSPAPYPHQTAQNHAIPTHSATCAPSLLRHACMHACMQHAASTHQTKPLDAHDKPETNARSTLRPGCSRRLLPG